MKPSYNYCAKCGIRKRLTNHHIMPKCHFGDGVKVRLCVHCHRKLEAFILVNEGEVNGRRKRRPYQFYLDMLIIFLTNEDVATKKTRQNQ